MSQLAGADALAFTDRIHIAKVTLTYAAGSGAGASVAAAIPASVRLPNDAVFLGNLVAGVSASVSGNTVTFTPTNAANTLAAGSAVALVIG